ncbi:S-layer homology domain-containing protein [Phascolarctobacterium sp. Marseille-Q4147]|uniref:S-layer homology domain-containing protein n=1 Tax=Phascolarctobacterium sp. Marseille-Q4147 TaxID=2823317 RepID=UPI001B3412E2|nr:S-layer homology domain-containing protein [Phascolarctobacterium sp. Marseille-Q4147]QTV77058.1 S-layer homology domain-containing protein [Phascolarctobacterium sp. Marseille-Q4147]
MKKSLVLAMAMALGVTASAYAANPFSDVPAGHWAYDSINKLAAAGVIEGYGDTTFGGDKLMTRYEMAQIVAKAMAKGANVDKLAAEFADELDNLGVRVANLEKKADNVKITGETKYRYWDYDRANGGKDNSKDALRSRIWVNGAINDDWTYKAMLENIQTFQHDNVGDETVKFQRAYVTGKLGGMAVQAGRYQLTDFTGGNIYDQRLDGVQVAYGKDVKLTVGAGKAATATGMPKWDKKAKAYVKDEDSVAEDTYYANLGAKLGVVDANVGYYKFTDVAALKDDDKIWTAGVAFPVLKDLKLSAVYLKSDVDTYNNKSIDDDGYVIGLDYKGAKAGVAGSYGIFAKYYDQAAGTFVAHTMEGENFGVDADGFKGYMVGANYTFAKNIVGAVKYFDLEGKKGDDETNTLYAELNFMF